MIVKKLGDVMAIEVCNSLQEVREHIDALDLEIVSLIAKRNAFIHQAAKFKVSVDEVKAPDRVGEVINNVRMAALERNLNPNLMTEIYTLMIHEMVESEISEFRNAKDL